MMDLKRNERFYKQNDLWRLLGGGLLIVGLIWFWIGITAASYYGPCVMVPVGLVMFLVASSIPLCWILKFPSRNTSNIRP